MGQLKLSLVLKIGTEVCRGMDYLHKRKVCCSHFPFSVFVLPAQSMSAQVRIRCGAPPRSCARAWMVSPGVPCVRAQIVHRDLKAANLLMDETGTVKIADFGVARVMNASGVMTAETGTYRWGCVISLCRGYWQWTASPQKLPPGHAGPLWSGNCCGPILHQHGDVQQYPPQTHSCGRGQKCRCDRGSANVKLTVDAVWPPAVRAGAVDFAKVSHQCLPCAPRRWMAPEGIEHSPYMERADVFSFAITLWELLTGRVPYDELTPLQARAHAGTPGPVPSHACSACSLVTGKVALGS